MFQFPGFATHAYGFSVRSFRDLGINARMTATPSLSQSSTPFIAFWRQDIPHMPLVAWPHCSCPFDPEPPQSSADCTCIRLKEQNLPRLDFMFPPLRTRHEV